MLNKFSRYFLISFLSSLILATSGQCTEKGYTPVAVIELFTSEGCSSCPPADKTLREWTQKSETDGRIFTLGFHVDYWDGLGWPDRFSVAEYTQRQRDYARVRKETQVYTPQMIVNGKEAFGGYRDDLLKKYVSEALISPASANIQLEVQTFTKSEISIIYTIQGPAEGFLQVALVETDLENDVTRGENRGKVLSHANVVREFQTIDLKASSGVVTVTLPGAFKKENLRVIAFLQDPKTWEITAASQIKIYKGDRVEKHNF